MIIKINALDRLREVITCEVPTLRGKICVGSATRDRKLKFPHVSLIAGRFKFVPHQADERDHVRDVDRSFGPRTAVFDVGLWQGPVEIKIGAKSAEERWALEYYIEQVFLGNASGTAPDAKDVAGTNWMRPGIILIDVPECDNARCAFELDEDSWENEKVFANEWYSSMQVIANIPALVRAKCVPDMDTLELSLTHDLDTVVTSPAEADALPDVESVEVQEDGSIIIAVP